MDKQQEVDRIQANVLLLGVHIGAFIRDLLPTMRKASADNSGSILWTEEHSRTLIQGLAQTVYDEYKIVKTKDQLKYSVKIDDDAKDRMGLVHAAATYLYAWSFCELQQFGVELLATKDGETGIKTLLNLVEELQISRQQGQIQ
jgi:hypothetical protein